MLSVASSVLYHKFPAVGLVGAVIDNTTFASLPLGPVTLAPVAPVAPVGPVKLAPVGPV